MLGALSACGPECYGPRLHDLEAESPDTHISALWALEIKRIVAIGPDDQKVIASSFLHQRLTALSAKSEIYSSRP